jgi:hypothetical protein
MGKDWIKVGDDQINPAYIALVERGGGKVAVHLALPQPDVAAGITYQMDGVPPIATGHLTKYYNADEWDRAIDLAASASDLIRPLERRSSS